MRGVRRDASALVSLALAAALAAPAAGQYFGRNKVAWEDHDFQVRETGHFRLLTHLPDSRAAQDALRMAERWYGRLAPVFDHAVEEKIPIVLYGSHPDFQQTRTTGGLIGEGTGGFTEPLLGRVVLPLTGAYGDTDHVVGHELVHAFQFDLAQRIENRRAGLARLPLWMVEGLAEYLSQGRVDPQTAMWVRDALVADQLPPIERLGRDLRLSPYHWGQAVWAWIAGRWGDETAIEVFRGSLTGGPRATFERLLGLAGEELDEAWHQDLRAAFGEDVARRRPPGEVGRLVLGGEGAEGPLFVAPSLSPDGGRVAFLSSLELFTLDLFVADAATGDVEEQLLSAATDAHFDALRFVDSGGAWSPDGRWVAVVAIARGDNRIAIVDAATGRVERRIAAPGVDAISNPTFAPDGRTLVFSGQAQGATDLYRIRVDGGGLERLTDDLYADLQPVFAPDGRSLAFVSDRGPGADLGNLDVHPMGIHRLDLASRAIEPLVVVPVGSAANPQFDPSGGALYFLADPDGVRNLYRLELGAARVERITDVATGVTGITDLSPALTVASSSGRVMFTVFRGGRFDVRALEPDEARGEVVDFPALALDRTAGVLPPAVPTRPSPVATYLAATGDAPPRVEDPERDPYDPGLRLAAIGPAAVGVGTSRYGTGLAGSIDFYFSDLLGEHQAALTLRGGSTRDDLGDLFGARAVYLNRERRLNWGAAAARVPFLSASTFVGAVPIETEDGVVFAEEITRVIERTTIDGADLFVAYPLSTTRRWEVGVGYLRYSFDADFESVLVLGDTILDRRDGTLPAADALDLYEGSVAYVGDNSFWGLASPARGGRVRLELAATTGTLGYQTALADARRYFFLRPLTFAVRGLHVGRYGGDAESPRLAPLSIGDETLVRGYGLEEFGLDECTVGPGLTGCPELDRLLGSRLAAVNLELRLPVLGTKQYGLFETSFLPTELAAFVDAGVAWTEDESPELTWSEDSIERVPSVSAGLSLRMLVAGALPLELYYARPFQRPEQDEVWGFLVVPAW